MGLIGKKLQQQRDGQNTQNANFQKIPAQCKMCGSNDANLYVATENDRWAIYREVYKKHIKCFLCKSCAVTYSPSRYFAIQQEDKHALRAIPIYDESGNMLPSTHHSQLKLLPHWYPVTFLGDNNVTCTWVGVIRVADCIVLKLVPEKDQEYYMDIFLEKFGFIYTTIPLWYRLPPVTLPWEMQFSSYFDKNDRKRVSFEWVEDQQYQADRSYHNATDPTAEVDD